MAGNEVRIDQAGVVSVAASAGNTARQVGRGVHMNLGGEWGSCDLAV